MRPAALRRGVQVEPAAHDSQDGEKAADDAQGRGVALQVEFERQTLKPVFHLIGYRLWV
jgi:hypothetical protein